MNTKWGGNGRTRYSECFIFIVRSLMAQLPASEQAYNRVISWVAFGVKEAKHRLACTLCISLEKNLRIGRKIEKCKQGK